MMRFAPAYKDAALIGTRIEVFSLGSLFRLDLAGRVNLASHSNILGFRCVVS